MEGRHRYGRASRWSTSVRPGTTTPSPSDSFFGYRQGYPVRRAAKPRWTVVRRAR
jgi:hypothetical protein